MNIPSTNNTILYAYKGFALARRMKYGQTPPRTALRHPASRKEFAHGSLPRFLEPDGHQKPGFEVFVVSDFTPPTLLAGLLCTFWPSSGLYVIAHPKPQFVVFLLIGYFGRTSILIL